MPNRDYEYAMGNGNAWPDIVQLLAVAKYWYELYGAIPTLVTNDVVEFCVSKPVKEADIAMKLAMEHCWFCLDCVEQCGEDDIVGKRASSLLQSIVWYFWWD